MLDSVAEDAAAREQHAPRDLVHDGVAKPDIADAQVLAAASRLSP
jgi:hypothetical protein